MVSGQEMSIDTARLRQYREEVAYMVSFLEFSFNTLGDPQTTTRQKETIFNESFLKVFRDADVQVEDDLVVGRSTVTNKDVQAYLKDIDFFFRTVHFDYEVEEITHEVNPDGGLYFKVKAQRHLEGIDLDGDTINNFQDRYIEVNLHPEMQELKIASIYTTRVSQEESLRQWWTQLSPAWKAVFGPDIRVNDSTTLAEVQAMNPTLGLGDTLRWLEPHTFWMSDSSLLSLFQPLYPHLRLGDTLVRVDTQTLPLSGPYLYQDLERLQAREALDLSGHPDLSDLSPLSVFSELKTLDLSETAARDLTPLRNLTRLEVLKLAGTQVADLSPLRYALGLREINLNQSPMADLRPVGHFPRLQRLYLAHTRVEDLAPLAGLTDLRDLDLRHTAVVDLEPLQACTRLEALKVDHTFVQTLDPLHGLESLHTLSCMHTPVYDLAPLRFTPSLRVLLCDHTRIQSLEPLEGLSLLRKVYCDSTRVDLAEANRFLARRPEVLVVYESETLQQWWQEMPPAWQAYFRQHVTLDRVPTREQLHEASSVQEVDLTGQAVIASAAPLRLLHRLESLTLNGTRIDSLGALSELTDLSYLSLRGIPVRSLAPLAFLNRLAFLDVAETQVADLEPLRDLVALEYLSVEKTPVSRLSPLEKLPLLRQVYADETGVVVAEVQAFLKAHPEALVVFQTASLRTWWEALSPAWQSAFNEAVGVGDTPSTEALHQLVSLPTLRIENRLDITRLDPLTRMLQLKTLDLIGTRAADLSPLATQTSLESLTLAQNPVTDLLPLSQLKKLRVLNIENTPVEDLEPIGMLYALEELWVSGTAVRNLKPLEGLTQLVRLDCSNTEVRSLKPLDTLMELKLLKCYNSKVSSRHLDRFKEIHPACEVVFY
ncbi:MAG: leucine-rich repeat domain-containing protein [Bacteroidetes bacterium]|nr:MAG: leucine-rich repeat domain-containing protein [Bacteroidota bacterium]